jgi:hypothetical protein
MGHMRDLFNTERHGVKRGALRATVLVRLSALYSGCTGMHTACPPDRLCPQTTRQHETHRTGAQKITSSISRNPRAEMAAETVSGE